MNPFAGLITGALILVILLLPRRWAVLGLISGVIYVTQAQFATIAVVSFTPIRFIVFVAFIRVLLRKEFSFSGLNKTDKILVIFSSVYISVFVLHSMLEPSKELSLMYRIGQYCDGLFAYFAFRGLLNNPTIFRQFLGDMVFLIMPFTTFMIMEGVTGINLFSIMGAVPVSPILREGIYRCQGSFRHSITAGSFGATLFPLFVGVATFKDKRIIYLIGIIMCLLITILSHSSGPLMALIGGGIGWLCWTFREKMQIVRWAVVSSLVLMHLSMKAPVWFIFDRISGVIGGDGWHRSNLIDKFVNNFWEWWLMGMPIEKTVNWAATSMSWGGVDITNEYVGIGINGGLLSLFLFIWLLKTFYKSLGKAMEKIRIDSYNNKQNEAVLWGLGSALFSHILNLTAVSYWDQSYVMWYMLLAAISGVTGYYLNDDRRLVLTEPQSGQRILTTSDSYQRLQ